MFPVFFYSGFVCQSRRRVKVWMIKLPTNGADYSYRNYLLKSWIQNLSLTMCYVNDLTISMPASKELIEANIYAACSCASRLTVVHIYKWINKGAWKVFYIHNCPIVYVILLLLRNINHFIISPNHSTLYHYIRS